MQLPFVSRTKLERSERHNAALIRRHRAMKRQVAEARGASQELRDSLRRAEVANQDLQMKLLRIGFGYPPFEVNQEVQAAVSAPPATSVVTGSRELDPGLSDEEVQRALVMEGTEIYGNDIRMVMRHVETRQEEYYRHRTRQPILTPAQEAQRERVKADLAAAIEEGRLAAQGAK